MPDFFSRTTYILIWTLSDGFWFLNFRSAKKWYIRNWLTAIIESGLTIAFTHSNFLAAILLSQVNPDLPANQSRHPLLSGQGDRLQDQSGGLPASGWFLIHALEIPLSFISWPVPGDHFFTGLRFGFLEKKPFSCTKSFRLEPICLSLMSLTFWRLRTFSIRLGFSFCSILRLLRWSVH